MRAYADRRLLMVIQTLFLSWPAPGRAAVTACPGLNGTPVVDIFVNFAYCFLRGWYV